MTYAGSLGEEDLVLGAAGAGDVAQEPVRLVCGRQLGEASTRTTAAAGNTWRLPILGAPTSAADALQAAPPSIVAAPLLIGVIAS